jgi:hypothetical protein
MVTKGLLPYTIGIAAFIVFFAVFFAEIAHAGTNCGTPGIHQAIVWKDNNFSGTCDLLDIGSYPYFVVNGMPVGNDNISSVSVGSDVKVTLYENDLPGTGPGDWLPLITSPSVLANFNFNDKTSAIRVELRTTCPNPKADQVVVWHDFNFSGNCDVLDFGFPVTFAKMAGLSVGNDQVSSIKCGTGRAVTLWENDLNSGSSFSAAVGCSIPALTTFNDITSAIIVQTPPP